MTEHAVRFWGAGLRFEEMVQTLDYYKRYPIFSRYSSNINVVTEIARLSFPGTVFDFNEPVGGYESRPLLHLEQKLVDMMPHATWKFRWRRSIVLDPFFLDLSYCKSLSAGTEAARVYIM